MINAVSGASSSDYLWQLLQASKSTGTSRSASTNNVFSLFDTNGDGSISKSELSSALSRSSSANPIMGSDSDSTSSFVSLLNALNESIAGAAGANSTGSTGRLSGEEIFKKIDINGDGTLSKTEFEISRPSNMTVTQADELYSKLDTNKDGSISQSEFIAKDPGGPNGLPPLPPDATNCTSGSTDNSSSIISLAGSAFMQILKYAAKSSAAGATGGILGIV
ncbi:MAG: EF-hand domain-containing protein [Proteobacteria bacterium]|nr:EF-hand domain-containing protein [Pseudomonadota bacterium]